MENMREYWAREAEMMRDKSGVLGTNTGYPKSDDLEQTPIYYKAAKDDTVFSICAKYKISQADFKKWNGIDSRNTIKIGNRYIVGYTNDSKNANINKVQVTVTSKVVGETTTRSYADDSYLCDVPLYEVKVTGANKEYTFKAIRFGLAYKWNGNFMKEPEIVGLAEAQTHVISGWLPKYLSEINGFPKGAYIIYGGHYFHSGSTPTFPNVAVVGCIGIHGRGEWVRFCDAITEMAGTDNELDIVRKGKLVVTIEAASKPPRKNYRDNPNPLHKQ